VQEGSCELGAVDVWRSLFDLVAEAPQELRRLVHGRHRLRVDLGSDRRGRREGDAQARRIALHRLGVSFGRLGNHKGIAGLSARQNIERRRRVAHAARDHAFA
jgi:hypothetical protein